MSQSVVLHAGARFAFDGAVVEVTGLEGTRVTVRDVNNHWRTMTLTEFLRQARALEARDTDPVGLGHVLAGLSRAERVALTERAGHVRETLTGHRSGSSQAPRPGEPRAQYDPSRPLIERQHAKAEELGVTARTIRRWVEAYRAAGEVGLVDQRRVLGRSSTVDPRWETACRLVLAEQVSASTPTAQALLRQIEQRVEETYGPGEVPMPARAGAYRHLKRIARGTNALTGSAKGRRSIAARPKGLRQRRGVCGPFGGEGSFHLLLAPGGVGKTTVLDALRQGELEATDIDLRVLDKTGMDEALSSAIARGHQPVYLDALDEAALHEPAVFRIIERRLKTPAAGAVLWRIACRPAAWNPDLARAFRTFLGFEELRLLPLTRRDVIEVAGAAGADTPVALVEALVSAGLARLAATPRQLETAARWLGRHTRATEGLG
jgi:Helix-turn-helix domain